MTSLVVAGPRARRGLHTVVWRAAVGAAVFLVAGCTAARAPGPRLPDLSAADLQQLLGQRREALHALRSQASLSVSSPERSATARQFLLVQRPDRLRVEVFSPFGVVFALTASNGNLAAYVREENRVYRGAATPENLERYAGLDLEVADVVDVLLGSPPRRRVRSASVLAESATAQLRLRQQTDAGAQVVLFAGAPLLPVEVQEVDDEGELVWRASFGEYRTVDGIAVPTLIGFALPRSQQSAEISLEDPEANPALTDALFLLPTPPGASDVALDFVPQP